MASEEAPRLIDLSPTTIAFEGGLLLHWGAGEFVDKYPHVSILFLRQAFLELVAEEAWVRGLR